MELIERYLQAVGRALPPQKQADILTEIRSSLYDALDRYDNPDEATVVQVLEEMGSPHEVAAAYYPQNSYLIGPSLYPMFRLVVGIVFSAVIGVQLLLGLISLSFGSNVVVFDIWDVFSALPSAIGSVVIVFWILQHTDVSFARKEVFDPRKLPVLEIATQPIKRGETVFSIIVQVWVLVFLGQLVSSDAMNQTGSFFANPVLVGYFPWIGLSITLGIGVELWVLWRGHWNAQSRIAEIVSSGFSLVLISVLLAGHNQWLEAAGVTSWFDSIVINSATFESNPQVAGMALTRIILLVALLITIGEIMLQSYRLWRSRSQTESLTKSSLSSHLS